MFSIYWVQSFSLILFMSSFIPLPVWGKTPHKSSDLTDFYQSDFPPHSPREIPENSPTFLVQNRPNPINIPRPILPPSPPPQPIPYPQPIPEPNLTIPEPIPTPSPTLPDLPGSVTLQKIELLGNTAFSTEELLKLTQKFLNLPLTFAELLQIESLLTQHYVNAGYINSGAIIPAGQNLSSGVLKLEIIEGSLEKITITGTGRLNPNYIKSRLAIATKKPFNTKRLLQALQLLQLNPLIDNISADLSAGTRPDSSILAITVKPAQTFQGTLFLNNGRVPSVGSFERGVELTENNLSGWGDQLQATYTNTDGSNGLNVNYTLPINPQNGTLTFQYNGNWSEVIEPPFDPLDIRGNSSEYNLSYRQPIYQTANQELALGITGSLGTTQTSILGIDEPLSLGADQRGKTQVTSLRFFQDWMLRNPRSILALRSQFNLGIEALGATINSEPPDGRYFSWRGQAQYVQLLAPDTLLILRSNLQFSPDSLLSLEQFAIGGLGSVRGYRQDYLLTDNGIFFSVEGQIPILRFAPNQVLQIVPFLDYGQGWNNGEIETPQKNQLLGTGLGLQLRLEENFVGRFYYGIPLISVPTGEKRTWQENGIYFSVIYNLF